MLDATRDEIDLSEGLVHRTAEKLSTTISKMAGRREITALEQLIILTPHGTFRVHLAVRLGRIGRPLWLRRLSIDASPFRPSNPRGEIIDRARGIVSASVSL